MYLLNTSPHTHTHTQAHTGKQRKLRTENFLQHIHEMAYFFHFSYSIFCCSSFIPSFCLCWNYKIISVTFTRSTNVDFHKSVHSCLPFKFEHKNIVHIILAEMQIKSRVCGFRWGNVSFERFDRKLHFKAKSFRLP